jgi:uncharacterized membrane protein YqjE
MDNLTIVSIAITLVSIVLLVMFATWPIKK